MEKSHRHDKEQMETGIVLGIVTNFLSQIPRKIHPLNAKHVSFLLREP